MTSLRITEVVTTDVFAGTERYVADVSRELARRGHDVVVVGGAPAPMIRSTAPEVRWLPGASPRAAARALVRDGRRDVVHSHMTRADFVASVVAPATRAARVSTRHITVPRGHSTLARGLAPVVARRLHAEIAVSEWASQQLEHPAGHVLLNGVRAAPESRTRREEIVVVAQRLAAEKDTTTALGAFALSGLAARGWRLVVAGTGPELPQLERLATAHGIADSTDFVGWVEDVSALHDRGSVLLAPAPTEPCGLTVLEAMAHGLPVVAASAGGHLETVGQYSGAALFAAGDVAAAAAQLRRLADDAPTRNAYGDGLRALQRDRLTIEAHVDRLEQLYRDLVSRRRRPAHRRG